MIHSLKTDYQVLCIFLVTSDFLQWAPQGDQEAIFNKEEVGPLSKGILITKLAAGQVYDSF